MISIRRLASALYLVICCSSLSNAQTVDSTGNLITNDWSGAVTNTTVVSGDGSHTQSSGPTPIYNPDTNTTTFSYSQMTTSQAIAINQALSAAGTGIQVNGFNYSWEYYNQEWNRGTLSANISLYSSNNSLLESYNYSLGQTTSGWTSYSGIQNFNSIYAPSSLSNLTVSFTGRDDRFWAGYYGPMVRNVEVGLRYSIDPCVTDPQSSPSCPGFKTYYSIGDDNFGLVALPFAFPYYGKIFTHSMFFDNGVVSLYSAIEPQRYGGQQFYAESLSNNISSQFYYSIMPLWTDLLNYNGSFYTQGDSNHLKYTWENISQFGYPDRLNTFSLELRPSGYIGINYDKINIEGYPVTAGLVGNASLGEWTQIYRSEGQSVTTGAISNWSVDYTQATDCSNPLNNAACPGYQEAYFEQQCTISQLYSSLCPGYQQAYFEQQCTISQLYSTQCPGYQQAFLEQQCTTNQLYSTSCPGYSQAYAQKLLEEQSRQTSVAESSTSTGSTDTISSSSATTPGTEDVTRVDTAAVTDVGGVELSSTGSVTVPDGVPQTVKETAAASSQPATQTSAASTLSTAAAPGRPVNASALAVANRAIAEAAGTAQRTAEAAVALSQSENANPQDGTGATVELGGGLTLQGLLGQGLQTDQFSQANQQIASISSGPIGLRSDDTAERTEMSRLSSKENALDSVETTTTVNQQNSSNIDRNVSEPRQEVKEEKPQTGPSVRRGGAVDGMSGGDMSSLAAAPADFNTYLNAQLRDSQFYTSREIYRGQRNVDNQRLLRGLTGGSDRLHQEMIEQQYRIGQ
jgi:hypothetical protein